MLVHKRTDLPFAVAYEKLCLDALELDGPPPPRIPPRNILVDVVWPEQMQERMHIPKKATQAQVEAIMEEQIARPVGVFRIRWPEIALCPKCGWHVRVDLAGGLERAQRHAGTGHGQLEGRIVPPWDLLCHETTLMLAGESAEQAPPVRQGLIVSPHGRGR